VEAALGQAASYEQVGALTVSLFISGHARVRPGRDLSRPGDDLSRPGHDLSRPGRDLSRHGPGRDLSRQATT